MKAHEGTLRHMEREALDRGEGELVKTENPGSVQYYEKREYGKSHRYYKVDPFSDIILPDSDAVAEVEESETLDLTEWNKQREEFHKTERGTNCSARVYCPSCKDNGDVLMRYSSETVLSNAGNMPAKREVYCQKCSRRGIMLL